MKNSAHTIPLIFLFLLVFSLFFLLKYTREIFNNSSMQIKTLDGINSINCIYMAITVIRVHQMFRNFCD